MPATRARAAKPAAENGVEEAPAVPEFTTPETSAEEDRQPFFSINGEHFTRPEKIGPRLFYLGVDRIRDEGVLLASVYLNRLVLGDQQYARLLELAEEGAITDDQFDQITSLISNLFFKRTPVDVEGKGETTTSAPTSATT